MLNNLFPKFLPIFLDKVEKYCRAGETTDDIIVHARSTPDR